MGPFRNTLFCVIFCAAIAVRTNRVNACNAGEYAQFLDAQFIEYDKMFVHYAAWKSWSWDIAYKDTRASVGNEGLWLEFLAEAPYSAADYTEKNPLEMFQNKMKLIHVMRKQHFTEEFIKKVLCSLHGDQPVDNDQYSDVDDDWYIGY